MRLTLLILTAALTGALTVGCGRREVSTSSGFRVALILPGSENDRGWNQMARQALDMIAGQLGAHTSFVSRVSSSEFASRIDYFARDGYDVVICHGGEFEQAVAAAAKRFPNVYFIVGGCPNEIPGAAAVEFMARDASFLVGVVAAQVSRTKTAAFVGASPVPTLQACYDGMAEGLRSVPDAQVKPLPPLWTNSWDSPTLAKEHAETAINSGADVLFQNVDAAASGVFEAVVAANRPQRPVWAFGCNSNQNALAPEVILGSVVIDVQRAYLDLARNAREGHRATGAIKLGLDGGYVDLVLSDHPSLTAAIRASVDAARAKLLAR